MAEQRFLVVRLGSLGDIVHTFPAVAGLRESFPSAHIIWLTHPRWAELVRSSQLANEIWPIDSRDNASVRQIIGEIRSGRWTAGIDYQGLWKSALPLFFGGVRKRIGFSSKTIREYGVPILYTDRVNCTTTHIADQNGELSLRAGARNAVGRVTLQISEADCAHIKEILAGQSISRYVVLSPGGGWRSKCWPVERFGALCQKIHAQLGLRCVINFGPGEDDLAAAVAAESGKAAPFACDGQLGELMALLKNAACIVGGDTGPLHLALALGTRAVALYGPTDPARNGPYPPQPVVLRDAHAITSHRRADATDPSLMRISVEEVFEAVQGLVGAQS